MKNTIIEITANQRAEDLGMFNFEDFGYTDKETVKSIIGFSKYSFLGKNSYKDALFIAEVAAGSINRAVNEDFFDYKMSNVEDISKMPLSIIEAAEETFDSEFKDFVKQEKNITYWFTEEFDKFEAEDVLNYFGIDKNDFDN